MPDAGERAWQYAAVALAQRARDWTFMVGVPYPVERNQARHLTHLGSRFPGDARLALAKAFADYKDVDVDLWPGRERLMASSPATAASQPTPRERVNRAIAVYEPLAEDPLVGGDAEVRMAHILYLNHELVAALEHASRSAAIGRDAAVRYQAQVLTGKILERLGRLADAGRAYGAALDLWPGGQSATLALAPWLVLSGQSPQADRIVSESLAAHPHDDDPWRLYHYGDYVRWPELVADMRKAIR
jgi:tetratricopeptide (TPR) repeat protein